MIDRRVPFLLIFLSLAAPARAAGPPIHLHGNKVIIDEVYLRLLKLPRSAVADQETAARVRRKLLRFLRRTGYELARVQVKVEDGALDVHIDEGRLERVLFLGAGSLLTLRVRLELDLPRDVFNRSFLDRRLKVLSERLGIKRITYKLVPIKHIEHSGFQLEDLGLTELLERDPGARFELRILLGGGAEWNTGSGVDLDWDFPDGLELAVSNRGRSLIVSDDRWLLWGVFAGKLRQKIESGDTYAVVSRAGLEARWYTPRLFGRGFRPFFGLQGELVSRQRSDLELELAYSARFDAALNLGYEFKRGLMISGGGGVEEKYLFGFERVRTALPPLEEGNWFRPFLIGRAELVFNPEEVRWDRRNSLGLEARHYFAADTEPFGEATWQYWRIFAIGFHDLVVRTRGAIQWGEVPFDEEQPVGGRYLRACFGDRYFVHQVGNLVGEFRMSLSRDLFKVSVFHDLALFGQQDRANHSATIQIANSFGLGFHALILDTIQFDIFYGFGFSSDGTNDHGASMSLTKVF